MEMYESSELTFDKFNEILINGFIGCKIIGISDDNGSYIIDTTGKTFSIDKKVEGIIVATPLPIVSYSITEHEKLGTIITFSLMSQYGVIHKEIIFMNINVVVVSG